MRQEIHRAYWAIRLGILLILSLNVWQAAATVTLNIVPGDQSVFAGDSVNFGVVVTASAGELVTGYQWLMTTNNRPPDTSVGNAQTLSLNDVQVSDAGYYYVIVSYQSGSGLQTISSSTVRLTVTPQPTIIAQPLSVTNGANSDVSFSVIVRGESPLHYQWQLNGKNLVDNGHITGAAGTNLDINNLVEGDAGSYVVVITNLYGVATSQVATLTVYLAPPVITSSTNAMGKQGYAFNYDTTTTGSTPITYGAAGLPAGLGINWTNGVISGTPTVFGIFNVTLFATNAAQTTPGNLLLTLATDVPVVTSGMSASGKQAIPFSYTITATNDPSGYTSGPLPAGLSLDPVSGIITGVPSVRGIFTITIGATNIFGSGNETLTLNFATSAPVITSSLASGGQQGQALNYTITASDNPVSFFANPLPAGLDINSSSGVISGIPLVSGFYAITIGAVNRFGTDSQTLTLDLTTGAPVINSFPYAVGTEEQMGFDYFITANNSPITFGATGLPQGLTVNTNTGEITGTPLYAGTYPVSLTAGNDWGIGTASLQLTVQDMVVSNLFIDDVMTNYLSPYLLEFKFSLRDGQDPTSRAVVASPSEMTVTAFEDGVPVSPSETSVILAGSGAQTGGSQSAKVLKGYLVLDFTESIAAPANSNGLSDAVVAEIASAQNFVDSQPAGSQIGVYEFHRDDEAPQQVAALTTDKNLLDNAIAGIWTNYVQDFPAGSRAWDAVLAATTALGPANSDEGHYVVLMSDGQDDSSMATLDDVIGAATNASVQVYAVGFGSGVDTSTLQLLTSSTLGRYYASTDAADLALGFAQIGKDLSSEYILRWATLNRSTNAFMPSFQITYQGLTAESPTNPPPFISGTNSVVFTNSSGDLDTNIVYLYTTNYIIPPYLPSLFASNVLAGTLRLVANADTNPTEITLRATYTPRYVRQVHLHYRANWPATLTLESTNAGGLLGGWTLTQTNDGAGGQWATLSSPDPTQLDHSIQFAGFGDLLTFSFTDPIVASNAFSEFQIDNTIYTNTAGTNFYGLTVQNTNSFFTYYVVPPPHGTPIPWLLSHGFTTNFAGAELLDPNGNGLAVWQDYLAGLNPHDTNATFSVQLAALPSAPQIVFNTVVGRTYRVEWAASPSGVWTILQDGIAGTGGNVTYTDQRDLTTVQDMFYRVVVEDP